MSTRSLLDLSPSSSGDSPRTPPGLASRRKRHLILAGIAAAVVVLLGLGLPWRGLVPATVVELIPVVIPEGENSAATSAAAEAVITAPGWVEPSPFPTAIPALADGVVAEVLFQEGDSVAAGQVMARLVADDARIDHAAAEAAAELASAEREAAGAELARATETWNENLDLTEQDAIARRMVVEARALLSARRSAELAAAARLADAKAATTRARELFRTGGAAEAEVLAAVANGEEADSAVAGAGQETIEAQAMVERREAEAVAAARRLALRTEERQALALATAMAKAAAAREREAIAMRDAARLRLDRMEVRSPAAGVVYRRFVYPGAKVMQGMDDPASAQVALLYDPALLQVRADVPLADGAKVAVGQLATVESEALAGRAIRARIVAVVPRADIQKNTIEVKALLLEQDPALRPDVLIRIAIQPGGGAPGSAAGGVLVPQSAIVDGGTVWVAESFDGISGFAAKRTVTLGGSLGANVRILSGLRAGDRVVVNPPSLSEGTRLRAKGKETDHATH